ncbi:MAG: porin, partial [Gammaproteobacteria bacterium]
MKKRKRISLGALIALTMPVMLVNPATAQQSGLLDTLLENGAITQQQYEQLKRQQAQEPPAETAVPADAVQDVVVTSRGGLRGRSRDGAFSYELGGRIMGDLAVYDEDVQELGNGSQLRRVRFDIEGTAWSDWGYSVELDFAEDEVEIKDTFLEYNGFEPFRLRFGNIKEPFSLEEQTSSL